MSSVTTLQAKQINHGQPGIWLAVDRKAITPVRMLATNEVVFISRKHCAPEVYEEFYKNYHLSVGHIAPLSYPNIDVIAKELKLKP